MKKLTKGEENGITLIALVVTIVVLLILAGITVSVLRGENGIIKQSGRAKTETEIDNEKEIVELATIRALGKDRWGNVTKTNLDNQLDNMLGSGEYSSNTTDDGITVKFTDSGRTYLVTTEGMVEYLGTEEELLEKVIITADKESNNTPEFVQNVELTVKTYVPVEDNNIALLYAWTASNEQEPSEEEFMTATLTGTNTKRVTTISSTVTIQGNYYLWVKVKLNEKDTPKTFGTYAIRKFTTLAVCANEDSATSPFLGSDVIETNITRNAIKNITIEKTLDGYSAQDSNCWDVSEKQDNSILAKYTEEVIDGITYYDIKIGSDGKVPANPNSSNLFCYIGYGATHEVTITGLENLDTSYVTDMARMFRGSNSLKSLDVSKFDTSNVTSMNHMFCECKELETLDVSKFDTSNVKSFQYMFGSCETLKSLDVSKFDTSNATSMGSMFYECENLISLDVSNFNTSNVGSMAAMFRECGNLTILDLSGFDTSNVTNMAYMFRSCRSLTILDVSNFDTGKVTDMVGMFMECKNVINLNVSGFKTNNITSTVNMFYGCLSVTSLDISNFDTSGITDISNMFYNCNSLTSLDLRNFNISNITTNKDAFYNIPSTTYIYVSTEDIQKWVLERTGRTTTEYIIIKNT